MEQNKQSQKVGDNSTSIQAGRNVYVSNGISYTEAKEIALDVFKTNFLQLSEEAARIAKERAEELTDSFLSDLEKRFPEHLANMNNPDIQYALYTAQKEYARSGNKDLFGMLVGLLVDRATTNEESLKKIVLNESLDIAPKLTSQQLNILSIALLIKHSISNHNHDLFTFKNYIKTFYMPYVIELSKRNSDYQHLEYTGCGTVRDGEVNLADRFLNAYPGLFTKGFSEEEFDDIIDGPVDKSVLLRPSFHNSEHLQVAFSNKTGFETFCINNNVDIHKIEELMNLQLRNRLTHDEVKQFLITLEPNMAILFEAWENSDLKSIYLTSVGIAIGNANIKRKSMAELNLDIWLKDN